MPALYTHYCFSKYAAGFNAPATLVGGQGPDTFFFYGMYPFRRKNKEVAKFVNNFGRRMHKVDVAPYYNELFKIASKSPDFKVLDAYLDGLLLHYCLDSEVHPYVFYRSGKSYDSKLSKLFSRSHCFFETLLDIKVKKHYGFEAKPQSLLVLPKEEANAISKMWVELQKSFPLVEGNLTEDGFSRGLKDYHSIEKFLYSRTGIKRFFVKLFMGKTSQAYCLSYPRKLGKYEPLDFENNHKYIWLMPVSGAERDESLYELFDLALAKFKKLQALKERAYKGEDILAEFKAITKAINHDGTLEGEKMSYSKLIWEEL